MEGLVLSGIEYDKSSGIVSGTLHELPKKAQTTNKINQVESVLEHWKDLRTRVQGTDGYTACQNELIICFLHIHC